MRACWLIVALAVIGCGGESPSITPHALVVGLDGVRPDALQAASTPRIDSLIAEGVVTYDGFAGGVPGTSTEQRTLSGPGWTSILTGVWIDKHGVGFNTFNQSRIDAYPHFFGRIRELNPTAYLSSFVSWAPINEEILAPGDADVAVCPDAESSEVADVLVTEAVLEHLTEQTPDVVFVHLDNTDAQGHLHGFSPAVAPYLEAIERADSQIGRMLDALRARPSFPREDWLVVLVTDHGGLDHLHGGQSPEERTIPIVVSGGSARAGVVVSSGPGHTVVPPTVLHHLGLRVDEAWGWEDEAFGY